MKKIVATLLFFLGSNIFPCKQKGFLEIFGCQDNIFITVKMNFPPRFSHNILEGFCHRAYGSIKLENKGDKACKLFFVDLDINGEYLKCKNTDFAIMRYVNEFLNPNQSQDLRVRWDVVGNYNEIHTIEKIVCPINTDILDSKYNSVMQIDTIRFVSY